MAVLSNPSGLPRGRNSKKPKYPRKPQNNRVPNSTMSTYHDVRQMALDQNFDAFDTLTKGMADTGKSITGLLITFIVELWIRDKPASIEYYKKNPDMFEVEEIVVTSDDVTCENESLID